MKIFKYILTCITLLIFFTNCNKNYKKGILLKNQLDSLINDAHISRNFHGGIIVTNKNKTIYEKYIGFSNRKSKTKITKESKFDIASLNKSMIAALILKAVEENKLNLKDKLNLLLESFPSSKRFNSEITLHQMLCHISGLPDYFDIPLHLRENNFKKMKSLHFSNQEYVDFISKLKPINSPNKQFYYSNFSYHLLTIVLEEVYRKPFKEILKDNLTKPLGLKNTVSENIHRGNIKKLANGYMFSKTDNLWKQNQHIDLSLGRRIFSTVSDLNKWGQIMSNPGYLSKKSLMLMKKNHLKSITKNISYGYGWVVFDENNKSKMGSLNLSKEYIIHGGSTEGYKSMLVNINNSEYVISFLSNHELQNELELIKKITNTLNIK